MSNSIDTSLLNSLNQTTAKRGNAATSTDDLGDSFMTLLVTQLKNQDPTKPMENAEMTSQLAQINTVNGINDLNETLQGITRQIDAGQSLQASALIGKGVLVPGNEVRKGDDATTPFGIELDAPADDVTISIVSASGEVVRQYGADDVGSLDEGVHSFSWDGKDMNGQPAENGVYHVRFETAQGGESVPATALNYAPVQGVLTGDEGPRLDLGAIMGQVGLDAVRQIL
ncbi:MULTISPECIES: flagellar hook assembly protein FlgD [unclassified Modicisalibacter]|uniref:flagellar hook assembly protein FlgD n=1 Tax=unclassified Modicisalibacter TaxID=2679913 RepID=UPI001CCB054D|nr:MULTISPECIES: flagellar hook assembly protein FlgD [unclassified Modicisalibacter]MBZ9556997.1 flagellar hook assembly protein FlgD [Modicisalibacter sp. R2A 31.J]MBZ9574289.1 flagellar hook assembly protein FlgD [Modicisalibacter sp. MOD 31.J]